MINVSQKMKLQPISSRTQHITRAVITAMAASLESEEMVAQLLAQRSVELKPDLFANAAAVKLKSVQIEGRQIAFVDALAEDQLHQAIEFHGTRVKIWHLLQHLVNHSTYHRGQVTLMMRQLGAETVETDFHVLVMQQNLGRAPQ